MSADPHATLAAFTRLRRVHRNRRLESEVWEARDANGRPVALKIVSRECDPEAQALRQERLQAEVDAGRVLHEHVRPLLAHGSDLSASEPFPDGADWLAFEWVDGPSLRELLEQGRQAGAPGLDARALRDLTRAVANGLAAMHRATPRWVHRDVKPENVLLPQGDVRAAMLADMGVAWCEGSPRLSRVVGLGGSGTTRYMAPEQFESDEEVSPATDQYALALIVWEAACGFVPYATSEHASDIARARQAGGTLPPLTVAGRPASALQRVLARALALNPGERWANLTDFWRAFHAAGVDDRLWDHDVATPAVVGDGAGVAMGAPAVPGPLVAPRGAAGLAGRPDFDIPGTWIEQEIHLSTFVGRDEVIARCQKWLHAGSTDGYLVVVGPPGQGKSALMARLAREAGAHRDGPTSRSAEPATGVALLHTVKSHREPRRILQALLSQADRWLGDTLPEARYRENLEDLRAILTERLEALAARYGSAVVFVDALDELAPEGQQCTFLPPRLPRHVRGVLSSRPDVDLLTALQAHVGELTRIVLAPMAPDDSTALLAAQWGADATAVAAVLDVPAVLAQTGGAPIVLRYAADRLRPAVQKGLASGTRVTLAVDELASSADVVFRDAYARIAGRHSATVLPEAGRARATIAQVLACAQQPLSAVQLHAVLRVAGIAGRRADVLEHLEGISQFLQPLDGMFALYHRGLVDYVRREVLGDEGVAEVHTWYLAWLASDGADELYYRAHATGHLRDRWTALRAAGDAAAQAALRDWMRVVTSFRYARPMIEAGQVYAFREELESVAVGFTGHEKRDIASLRATLGEELIRFAEWVRLLEANAHVLARWPHLLVQQLRNAPESSTLREDAAALPLERPVLVVTQRRGEARGVSRLVRQTVPSATPKALALHPNGKVLLTTHEHFSCRKSTVEKQWRLGAWQVTSGNGDVTSIPRSHRLELFGGGTSPLLLVVREASEPGHLIATTTDGARQYTWPPNVGDLRYATLSATCAFLAFDTATAESAAGRADSESPIRLMRLDFESGNVTPLTELPATVCALAAPSDGEWVAVVLQSTTTGAHGIKEYLKSEICIVDGHTGRCISRVERDEPTYWIGVSRVGVLLSSDAEQIRVWSVPQLRELWNHPRGRARAWMSAIHPTLPRVALFEEHWVRILDLEQRKIIRQETWIEAPSSRTALSADGTVLVGDLGDPTDLDTATEVPLGVWHLPAEFWEAEERNDTSEPHTFRFVIGTRPGTQRTLELVNWRVIVESEHGRPMRAYVGEMISVGTARLLLENDALLLACGSDLHVLDLDAGHMVRRLRATDATFMALDHGAGTCRVTWRAGASEPAVGTSDNSAVDHVVASLLASGVEIRTLEPCGDGIDVPSLPWEPVAMPAPDVTAEAPVATSLLDPRTGEWAEFVQLSIEYSRGADVETMPGGQYLLVRDEGPHPRVLHARTGEELLDLGYDVRVLKILDEHRLFCCDDNGSTWISDVRDGSHLDSEISLGFLAHVRTDLAFDVSPDQQLAVWNEPDAIVVGEVGSGREIARFPAHRWDGNLTFRDQRTILAHRYGGEDLELRLEGH